MKKDKFQLFLEQSKFQHPILNKAELAHVSIDTKNKSWQFNIVLNDVLEPDVLLPFIQQLKSYFYVPRILSSVEIQLTYKSKAHFEACALAYFDYAIIELSKEKLFCKLSQLSPLFVVFKNTKWLCPPGYIVLLPAA